MDRNGSVIVLLFVLFIVVFRPSDAISLRKLVTIQDPNGGQDSPISTSPPPPDKTPGLSPVGAPKPKDKPVENPTDLKSEGVNDANNTKNGSERSSDKKLDTQKNQDGKRSKTFASESCKSPICKDQGKIIMACVQDFENGSNNLTLMVQNEQDVDLKVNITYATSINNYLQTFELPANATEKVNITFSGAKSDKVILKAGNGDCELQISQPFPVSSPSKPKDSEITPNVKDVNNTANTPAKPKDVHNATNTPAKPNNVSNPTDSPTEPKDMDTPPKNKNENDPPKSKDVDDPSKPKEAVDTTKSKSGDVDDSSKSTPISLDTPVSKNNVFDQLTFYSKQVTPMHGAYLAFLVALVIGGSWALCSIRKRRTGGGVPYQELEMGPTESSNAAHVETAEGWDQDWDDDDWDEDKAIRSPGGSSHAKAISSNGLTSRATKKDDWDANWDD